MIKINTLAFQIGFRFVDFERNVAFSRKKSKKTI
jgi:hypothetical protein